MLNWKKVEAKLKALVSAREREGRSEMSREEELLREAIDACNKLEALTKAVVIEVTGDRLLVVSRPNCQDLHFRVVPIGVREIVLSLPKPAEVTQDPGGGLAVRYRLTAGDSFIPAWLKGGLENGDD